MQIVHHLPSLLQDWTLHTVHTVNTCTQHTTSPLWGCIECIECTLFAHIAHYISKPPSCTFPGFLLKSGKSLVTPVVLLPLYSFTNVGYFEPDTILGNLHFPSPFSASLNPGRRLHYNGREEIAPQLRNPLFISNIWFETCPSFSQNVTFHNLGKCDADMDCECKCGSKWCLADASDVEETPHSRHTICGHLLLFIPLISTATTVHSVQNLVCSVHGMHCTQCILCSV